MIFYELFNLRSFHTVAEDPKIVFNPCLQYFFMRPKEPRIIFRRIHSSDCQHSEPSLSESGNHGISLMPEIYLEDEATGRRSALIEAEGISLEPERTFFAHNIGGYDMLNYTLTFEPVERQTVKINIIEPGHSGFSFYGVDIHTRLQPRLE